MQSSLNVPRGCQFYSICSLQGLRSKAGMFPHLEKPALVWYWNGCSGTSVIPVLSQMMRASDVCLRDSLWFSVKTPGFSHQSLKSTICLKNMAICFVLFQIHFLLAYRSPWRILWNWVAIRQANRGPTLPPRTNGSSTPPSHTSMLPGLP